jgi:hypothetical protein
MVLFYSLCGRWSGHSILRRKRRSVRICLFVYIFEGNDYRADGPGNSNKQAEKQRYAGDYLDTQKHNAACGHYEPVLIVFSPAYFHGRPEIPANILSHMPPRCQVFVDKLLCLV